MNRLSALVAERTITRKSHYLSADRPVCVRVDVFHCADGTLPVTLDNPDFEFRSHFCHVSERREVGAHDHEHCEILFILGGSAWHCTTHYKAPLSSGDVIFSVPGQTHAITQVDGLHRVGCVYLPEWLVHDAEDLLSEPGVLPLLVPGTSVGATRQWILHQSMGRETFDALLHELHAIDAELERDAPSSAYLRRCMGILLITLGRAFSQDEAVALRGYMRPEIQEALRSIEQYTVSDEPFHVSVVAAECNLSTSHFARLFRESTGLSPMSYYQQRRIQHGCWLLLHTDHSITEVAHALGFADTPHFVRQFHRLRGMPPREYRAYYRRNPAE